MENHGAARVCPAARSEATKKTRTARKGLEEVEVLQGSLHGVARALQASPAASATLLLPGWPRPAANTFVFEPASLS